MRQDTRDRVVTLIKEYMEDNNTKDVVYKDFMNYLKKSNELLIRIHVLDNKYMFGSLCLVLL